MVLKRVKQKQISFGYCDTRTGQRVYPPPPTDQMSDLLPEQQPPEQASFPTAEGSAMDIKVYCTPPLGQSTTIARDSESVRFTVALEHSLNANGRPEVVLWHNHNGEHEWGELPLHELDDPENVCMMTTGKISSNWTWFSGELSGQPKHGHKVSFTLKSRLDPTSDWRWMKDLAGTEDGTLHYLASAQFMTHSSSYELGHFFSDISEDIKIEQVEPETENTQLYSLTCKVNPAEDKESCYQHHRLGKAKKCEKWFALVRLWSPWLAPRHGAGDKFELDKEGVLVSFLRSDGLNVVCLAVSGVQDVLTTCVHDGYGNVEIKGRNDREDEGTSRVLVAVAESFEIANCAVMYHARKIIAEYGSSVEMAMDTDDITSLTDSDVQPEWLEEWYDGLTYCTWNGLGQNLTAQKIYDALSDLSQNDINITNLIIDDNWQSLSAGGNQFQRGWSAFEANKAGFPEGLQMTTEFLRQKFPNLKHIAVWHAILGYWGGIDPDGEIAKEYKTRVVEKEPGVAGGEFTVVDPSEAKRFYDDFYSFLSSNGIDAVKTDAQFFLDTLLHAPDRREMMLEYQDAWTLAHLRHFSSRAISCMSQFPQSLFHTQLPKNKPRLLVRNSDDFFPEVEASHAWHIFCNAHNSLFTQHLNALPDWDMFQTSHDWAAFHAAARCVSGGPIYFTDKPGEHDIGLIRQMTAQTPRGSTVILRPQRVGKAMNCYNEYHAQAVLKVGTYVGMQKTGTGILGCFNVCGQSLRELIHIEDFPGTEDGEYIVRSHRWEEVSRPMRRGGHRAMVGVELGTRSWELLTAYAVHELSVRGNAVKVAMMGLLGKMTGAAAVTNADMVVETSGRLKVWVSLKALGVLGLWISDLEEREVGDDFMVMIFGTPIPAHCVRKNDASASVLEVDVERAWKEMGLQAGWSNEVAVELWVG